MSLRRWILPLVIVSLLSGEGYSQPAELGTRLDQLVRFEADNNRFMGSVLVVRDDRVLFSKSYGYANIASRTPNAASTRYPIASLTKQFTAAAALLLETEGKLKLDASIRTYWPDAPAMWNKVTLFHLLSHTSGIPDITDSTEASTWARAGTAKDVLAYFSDKPLLFEPGSQFRYSNVGYILISFLIERISGETYADFLRKRIFTPLGMNDTGVDSTPITVARHATGYESRAGELGSASPMNMAVLPGAGDLYSTTEDMRLWFQGLFGGRVLPPESLRKLTTPVKEPWALGLAVLTADVGTQKNRTIVTHDGNVYGFSSGFAYFPEDRVMVIVLANVEGNAPAKLKEQLAEVTFGGTVVLPPEKTAVAVSDADLQRLAGLYEIDAGTIAIIEFSKGKLSARIANEPPLELFAQSASSFFARTIDRNFQFEADGAGAISGLVIESDGDTIQAKRLRDRAEVKLPMEMLRRYVGIYQIRPGLDVTISLQGDQLMAQVTGQSREVLYCESVDHFYLKTANVQLEFAAATEGLAPNVRIQQAGRNTLAVRR